MTFTIDMTGLLELSPGEQFAAATAVWYVLAAVAVRRFEAFQGWETSRSEVIPPLPPFGVWLLSPALLPIIAVVFAITRFNRLLTHPKYRD